MLSLMRGTAVKGAQLTRLQAVNWLRYGCLPVGVVEGRSPPEKRALQQQRWGPVWTFQVLGVHRQDTECNSRPQRIRGSVPR